ncbi:MAG: DciA family protein [Xanthomonadales bacterium]
MTRLPRSGKTMQGVAEVLNDPASSLSNILEHARYLMQLETLLTGLLDSDLAAQFQVAAARKNRLILISSNATWATRLRMQAPHLIRSLHAAGVRQIEYIDIRVAPLVNLSAETRSKRTLSAAAKLALGHMAHLK